jgi:acetaldehyde dehydrogenase
MRVAIVGPGNIGTDLMYKLQRSPWLELVMVAGVVPDSDGLRRARALGIPTTAAGINPVLADPSIEAVFDATGARAHLQHAPLLKAAGKIAIDLTPAAVGEAVVPAVNISTNLTAPNINLITCGGQATIPIVAAVARVARVVYAEIVSTIASASAGPGTRQNIDEFTQTTAAGLCKVGGAERGKAIIILNPAEPPILMRNTVYTQVADGDPAAIRASIADMVRAVQAYVPGYCLKLPPLIDDQVVTTLMEVKGAGDYLPVYAGNLDIMTAAAVGVGEVLARHRSGAKEAAHA